MAWIFEGVKRVFHVEHFPIFTERGSNFKALATQVLMHSA